MDIATFTSAIMQVGFPTVVAVACILYIKYITDQYREEVKELNRTHHSEIMEFKDSLDSNTSVMTRLLDKLDGGH